MTIHLVRAVASRLKRPTQYRQDRTSRMRYGPAWSCPDGVYPAQPVAAWRCALTAPFHPTFVRPMGRAGGLFSAALSWGRPRRALPGILILWSPDFPLPPDFSVGGSGHPAI